MSLASPAAVNEIIERRQTHLTLRELRENAGVTRAQVSKKLNVDLSCLSHWEVGDWKPGRKYHKALAKLYGCTVQAIQDAAAPAEK